MLIEKIGYPAMLEQTAEESVELAHALLKLARKTRDENPTPVTTEHILDNLYEEVADVLVCLEELELDSKRLEAWEAVKKMRIKERFGDA